MIYYALLSLFLFEYVRPGNYVPGLDALRLNAIIPAVTVLGTLFTRTQVSNKQFFEETNTKLMGTLLCLLCISTLLATVTMNAYTVTRNVFSYMLLYWAIVRHIGDARRLKGIFIALAGVHILVAILNPALFSDPENRVGVNSGSFLGDGNDFALSVNICIPIGVYLLIEARSKIAKIGWAVALLALVFGVIATKSRGGTLAFGAIVFYLWLRSERKVLGAAVAAGVVAIMIAVAPTSYFARMNTMFDSEESSAAARIEAWKTGTQMAVRSPLLGAGAGHFPLAYGAAVGGRWVNAHSIYFLMLGELGFPGLIVLLSLIFSNLAANRRLTEETRDLPPDKRKSCRNALMCTSAALIAFAVGGAFLSAAYYPHLYVLCGLMTAARRVVRAQIDSRADDTVSAAPRMKRQISHGHISPGWVPRPGDATAAWPQSAPRLS